LKSSASFATTRQLKLVYLSGELHYQKASQYAVEHFDGFGLTILGAFAKLRKATIGFVMTVCPSISPPVSNNSAVTERIFMKFYISILSENM
jgi:hypothetical protein